MTDPLSLPDNYENFLERYARPSSEAGQRIGREVLGHDAGISGYTTLDEAQDLGVALVLAAGDRLLDLGAGRGWPGSHICAATGCRLFATDLPLDALRTATGHFEHVGLSGRSWAAACDARLLPFGPDAFDAISHADVFC